MVDDDDGVDGRFHERLGFPREHEAEVWTRARIGGVRSTPDT